MTYDVCYSVKGDEFIGRVLKTVKTEKAAFALISNVDKLPAGCMHYAIFCEDGRELWNSKKQGLYSYARS